MGSRGEDFGVGVDVGFSGGGTRERHVVERSEEDAAVESVEVEEALELEVGGGSGFAVIGFRQIPGRFLHETGNDIVLRRRGA